MAKTLPLGAVIDVDDIRHLQDLADGQSAELPSAVAASTRISILDAVSGVQAVAGRAQG